MKRTATKNKLSSSKKEYLNKQSEETTPFEGNTEQMISTGSTLLDLAISGTRVKGGGLPGGILVEIFGLFSTGKTVLLCEIGGAIQRAGGDVRYGDPEARLNYAFARMFDIDIDNVTITEPDTVTELFQSLDEWQPEGKGKIHGIMVDSLAALSTEMEMKEKEGDKMGMRRAKEFSEGLRKFARILKQKNYLMVCSNQVRVNVNAGPYGQKYSTPGGEAVGFYASVRLRTQLKDKIKKVKKIKGKEVKKTIGIVTTIDVYKSSVDAPYRSADVYILFDYGVDDIRANLQFLKNYSTKSVYHLNGRDLARSIDDAIAIVEDEGLEDELKEAVTVLWHEIQDSFIVKRKKKKR